MHSDLRPRWRWEANRRYASGRGLPYTVWVHLLCAMCSRSTFQVYMMLFVLESIKDPLPPTEETLYKQKSKSSHAGTDDPFQSSAAEFYISQK